jgi:hypothetical protein
LSQNKKLIKWVIHHKKILSNKWSTPSKIKYYKEKYSCIWTKFGPKKKVFQLNKLILIYLVLVLKKMILSPNYNRKGTKK